MDLLWPDLEPEAAANNLRKALHVARRLLEPDHAPAAPSRYLHLQGDLLRLDPPGTLAIDVAAFEAAAAAARAAPYVRALQAAVDAYAGDLLPEDRYEDWAVGRRDELRGLFLSLLLELAAAHEEQGDPPAAIEALRRLVASDPAHEEAHLRLMRLHARAGQRHQALRQFEHLRVALRRELDAEPGAAARQLFADILAGRLPAAPIAAPAPGPLGLPLAGATFPPGPPLIGRDAEIEAIEEALDALFAGRGGFVLVAGEAGAGKSRLAAEAAARVRRRGGRALSGAAYEQEGQLPYGPFIEALDRFHREAGPDAVRQVAGPAFGDLARLLPGVAAAPEPHAGGRPDEMGDAGAPDRSRLFAAVAGFLGRLAAGAPALLALDDLHAGDTASLQLLHYLARAGPATPLLLLATYRPEEAGPATPLGQLLATLGRERLATRLELGRLDPRASEILTGALLGGDPCDQPVFAAIYALAAGNPFYTEEAVRDLRESGQLAPVAGRWRLQEGPTPVPGRLAELVAARLERLAPAARQVLQLAAVVGHEAPYVVLRAATELSEGELLDALEECLSRRIVEETAEGYRFGHPLQRAALYARLQRARRASLHARVAAAIEALAAGELVEPAEALAHHWGQSDQPGRAFPHLVAAGDRASALHAPQAAIDHYRRALEVLGRPGAPARTPARAAALWEKIGDSWGLIGEAGRDADAYREALALLDRPAAETRLVDPPPHSGAFPERAGVAAPDGAGDLTTRARLHRKAAGAHLACHAAAAAEPHLVAAEGLLAGAAEGAEAGRLRCARANWLWERGRYAEAQTLAEESLDLAQRHGTAGDLADAYLALGIIFHFLGEWQRGLHFEIQRLGATADDPQLAPIFDIHHCIGQYHLYGDRSFPEVESYARRTLDLANRMGARRAQAFGWCLHGEALLLPGRWDQAEASLRRSTELHQELGAGTGGLPWQRLGELAVYRGDAAAAAACLRQGLAIAAVSPLAFHLWGRLYATTALAALEEGDPAAAVRAAEAAAAAARDGACPTCGALLHPVAAEAYAAVGDPSRAEEHVRAAEQVAGIWESTAWRAMAEMARGSLARARGDPAAAGGHFLAAATMYEQAGQPFWAARCRLQAAGVRAPTGEIAAARALLEQAAADFRALGAVRAEARARAELGRLLK
jgi:DNA-binding SARP family transcriptional activator